MCRDGCQDAPDDGEDEKDPAPGWARGDQAIGYAGGTPTDQQQAVLLTQLFQLLLPLPLPQQKISSRITMMIQQQLPPKKPLLLHITEPPMKLWADGSASIHSMRRREEGVSRSAER